MGKLILDNLTIGYHHKVVAGPLNANLESHGLVCLIGNNGSGKSTLLRTISGLQLPISGDIVWHDGQRSVSCPALSKESLSRLVSIVLTEQPDSLNISAHDVVAMGRMPYTGFFGSIGRNDEKIVAQAIDLAGATELANRAVATLSDGERQKVMIARAIAQQTPMILLDEPTAFLDYYSKNAIMSTLHSIAMDMGKLIVVSTHDLDIARRYADRFITISRDGIRDMKSKDMESMLRI